MPEEYITTAMGDYVSKTRSQSGLVRWCSLECSANNVEICPSCDLRQVLRRFQLMEESTMSERKEAELAKVVNAAASALNKAIAEATKAGLQVSIDYSIVSRVDSPSTPMVKMTVSKIL